MEDPVSMLKRYSFDVDVDVTVDDDVETGARGVPPNRVRLRIEGEGMDESTAERRAISGTPGSSLREVDPV